MKTSFWFFGRKGIASLLLCILPSFCLPAFQTSQPVEALIKQLQAPEGKVRYAGHFGSFGGSPVFRYSTAMEKLIAQGNAAQARLLHELKDARIRNEIVITLGQIGDQHALPHLIEFLPTKEKLTEEESFTTMCLLHALGHLTSVGHGSSDNYTPECRQKWQAWYESYKDYLYIPLKLKLAGWDRVKVDVEAKMAARPTSAYRKDHPWVTYEEIKIWRDDPAYDQKLKDFCFSIILNHSWNANGYPNGEAVRSLGRIRDPRGLSALHTLCTFVEDISSCHTLIWTLDERGDPASIPFLEKIPRTMKVIEESLSNEPMRLRAIERIKLLERYGKELKDKPFGPDEQTAFMKCLENSNGVAELIANLRNREKVSYLPGNLRVAGYVDQEPVRSCLKQMVSDKSLDDRTITMVHGALARLGEKDSLDQLKRSLKHKLPGVRLAAAASLWHLGNREGVKALMDLLDLRPIETSGEGVQVGNGTTDGFIIKSTAINGTNLEYIRAACEILGEMRDRSAVEPLQRLLPLNLNGVVATGGSGFGWSGRPDVVALATMGDFSGISVLRESIGKGDRLGAAGSTHRAGDYVEIGLKRFIPDILPLFEDGDETKRVEAAQAVLLLLESGR
jgi:HEAT repeat protein